MLNRNMWAFLAFVSIATISLLGFLMLSHELYGWKLIIIVQIVIGLAVIGIHIQNFITRDEREKWYWLFFSIASLFSCIGSIFWLSQLRSNIYQSASFSSVLCWAISATFYLFGLVNRLIIKNKNQGLAPLSTNLIIYTIAAFVTITHYLVRPLYTLNVDNMDYFILLLFFQLIDISLLFFTLLSFYSEISAVKHRSSSYLTIGLILLITSDFFYAFIKLNGYEDVAYIGDLIWTSSLLLIGVSSYLHRNEEESEFVIHSSERSWINHEFIFPYATIIGLVLMYIQNTGWEMNDLGIGLLSCFLIVMVRQAYVFKQRDLVSRQLEENLYYDEVTGLRNKSAFRYDISSSLKKKKEFSLILISLDRYNTYEEAFNDILMNRIIKQIARKILYPVKERECVVFRTNANEFTLISYEKNKEQVAQISTDLLRELQKPIQVHDIQVNIIANIGISRAPEHSDDLETLVKCARDALHQSRKQGPFRYLVYDSIMKTHLMKRIKLESYLKNAIKYKELSIHYQPKVNLLNDEIIGMEALLRWNHPDRGWISPAEFIPLAEETGLINEIGEWVIRNACLDLKRLHRLGHGNIRMSVNVSLIQFQDPSFPDTVKKMLDETMIDPADLELEITESIVQNFAESTVILQRLLEMGVQCSIDDFGTGYSSLNVLERLPIHTLKIDKSFIDRLSASEETTKSPMAKTIIDMGLNLNLNIVAEGIEHDFQREKLLQFGCVIGQGYLFAKPLTFDAFIAYLNQKKSSILFEASRKKI